jgi:hypothetical protein
MISEIEPQKPRDHVWHVELPRMKQLIARAGCPIGPGGPILGSYRFRRLSEFYSIRNCVTSPTVFSLAGALRLEHSCPEPRRRTKHLCPAAADASPIGGSLAVLCCSSTGCVFQSPSLLECV